MLRREFVSVFVLRARLEMVPEREEVSVVPLDRRDRLRMKI